MSYCFFGPLPPGPPPRPPPLPRDPPAFPPRFLGPVAWFPFILALEASSLTRSITSSGIRKYFIVLPLMKHSGIFQNLSPSLEVQMTSLSCIFIQLSQLTRCPLYVSPFLSSTNIGLSWAAFSNERGNILLVIYGDLRSKKGEKSELEKMAKRCSTESLVEGKPHKKGRTINKTAEINKHYTSRETLQRLHDSWKLKAAGANDDINCKASDLVTQYPYVLCNLPDFLQDSTDSSKGGKSSVIDEEDDCSGHGLFITELMNELDQLEFHDKNNDLYQFSQSDDLKNFSSPCIKEFRRIMEMDMLPWLRTLTDFQLTGDVSMTCSKYKYTDRLLCHDDQLDCRRIAFIYYLVPHDWCANDGGTLDLFDMDDHSQPHSIAKSIVPKFNNFVFFKVSPESFHQVSEVLSPDKTRLSINGWFHASSMPCPHSYIESLFDYVHPKKISLKILEEWINPVYLDIGVQVQIQQQFEEDSQIELPNFIIEEKFIKTCEALSSVTDWKKLGPPDKRCVFRIVSDPHSTGVLNMFYSDPFCLLLSHMTGLQLSNLYSDIQDGQSSSATQHTDNTPAYCYGDILLWKPGCYTLMHPENEFILELVLHFNANGWTSEMGGTSSYILKNEDQENNSLYLVYKDRHTLNYVQYLNNKGCGQSFHTVSMLYKEGNQPSASDHEDDGSSSLKNSDESYSD